MYLPLGPTYRPVHAAWRCRRCAAFFTDREAVRVGRLDLSGRPPSNHPEWEAAEPAQPPTEADYYAAARAMEDRTFEQRTGRQEAANTVWTFRTHAWVASNRDPSTGEVIAPAVRSADWVENVEVLEATAALAALAGGGDGLTILRAELARQRGRLVDAGRLLDRPFGDPLRHHAHVIRELASAGRTEVAPVHGNEAVTPEERAENERLRQAKAAARARERDEYLRRQAASRAWSFRRLLFTPLFSFESPARRRGVLLREGRICPRCYSERWTGAVCEACRFPNKRL